MATRHAGRRAPRPYPGQAESERIAKKTRSRADRLGNRGVSLVRRRLGMQGLWFVAQALQLAASRLFSTLAFQSGKRPDCNREASFVDGDLVWASAPAALENEESSVQKLPSGLI